MLQVIFLFAIVLFLQRSLPYLSIPIYLYAMKIHSLFIYRDLAASGEEI